jgi:peptide chain release factor 2
LKEDIETIRDVKERIELLTEFFETEDISILNKEINELTKLVESLRLEKLLNGEFDSNNAYIEIHSGAGGTEANDWADMLYRMYIRYFSNKSYKYEIIDESKGEEVGLKGITVLVKGKNVYGFLKGETGVHRLVRISPFDSNARRHTSFASVLVIPEIDKKINIEIKDEEIRIDVYRSSGAGGQSVNTTDSAVRITHIPTGIVVTCQNERSQIKNKEKAIEMLKSKLYIYEKSKLDNKLSDLKGSIMDVNFGSQIRSYVMCPYTMVKDHRTNAETSNVKKVLDGDLDYFINEYINWK